MLYHQKLLYIAGKIREFKHRRFSMLRERSKVRIVMPIIMFSHPEPQARKMRVLPVFLPFQGCPFRCVYCAQDVQTGQGTPELDQVRDNLVLELDRLLELGADPLEVAFYGGTFTALPDEWPEKLLKLTAKYRDLGLVARVRCSTRPDCIEPVQLNRLRELGLDLVELGVQSFDTRALVKSGRGYDADIVQRACETVRKCGLDLGLQLMPGLPGDRPGVFRSDVERTARIAPDIARLYPCLVINGTRLADMWRAGKYRPWSLARAKNELALALNRLWKANVRVVRTGLAPEPALREGYLAGPWHPALGQSVRSLALLGMISVKAAMLGPGTRQIMIPRRFSGEIMGQGRELAPSFERLGLGKGSMSFWDKEYFVMESK